MTLRRKGGRTWLEGVAGWSWQNRRSSVHAAQAAVMEALGEAVSYQYLVGVSGLAFRMQLSQEGFCPSSPHPFCGCPCVARSRESLPWTVAVYESRPGEEAPLSGEVRRAVAASIDRGVPVQYGREEDGIVVGYQKDGEEWLCFHPEHDDGATMFVETSLGWGVAVVTARKETPPDRGILATAALRQAVEMAGARHAGRYFAGFAAWEEFIHRVERPEFAGQEALRGIAWIYACLAHHRACAASYLCEVEGEFPGPAAGHIRRAAELYQQISARVLTVGGQVPDWTRTGESRGEPAGRLREALRLERQAIAAIAEAL